MHIVSKCDVSHLVESVPDVIKAACERDADLPYCKVNGGLLTPHDMINRLTVGF